MNSHLLPLFIFYRSNGEKLIKYQANSSCVIMSVILMTTLVYKALILQGEIWCWSLLGLKGLTRSTDMIQLTLTLKVTITQVVETSVSVNNSPIQDYNHLDDYAQPTYEMSVEFKPLTVILLTRTMKKLKKSFWQTISLLILSFSILSSSFFFSLSVMEW